MPRNKTAASSLPVGCSHCSNPHCGNRTFAPPAGSAPALRLVLAGNPNVGKSVIFNQLTGLYVTVSNYPGTTVEISRGRSRIQDLDFDVIDTPGMYSLLPITEEERVARDYLFAEPPDVLLHVIDAKNLERMLPFTIQLLEAGLPVILVLNIMDEAERLGMSIDTTLLSRELGIPVIPTVSTTGRGLDQLRQAIVQQTQTCPDEGAPFSSFFPEAIETAISRIKEHLHSDYGVSRRSVAILLLQGDEEIHRMVRDEEKGRYLEIRRIVDETCDAAEEPLAFSITMYRQEAARDLTRRVTSYSQKKTGPGLRERLSQFTMEPWTGIPLLLLVLYFGLYKFVGVFGAGTVVDLLEGFFTRQIMPLIQPAVKAMLPWPVLQDLVTGEYGIITLAVRYAFAIILPVVGTFFLFFSILEDSGYFPRLAMLVDRVFKKIGLNGRAVIPLILGLGCGTMATVTTRTLETKRERLIATLLLAIAIPCSAQLGVTLALLSGYPGALAVWAGVVLAVFVTVGSLAARLVPGQGPSFYMELPPLRFPQLGNIVTKTGSRIKWYIMEVFPIFIMASVLIWLGRLTGVFDLLIRGLTPLMQAMGLPQQAAVAFIFGFFRRDYGAAGLFDLSHAGLLSPRQLTVAAVTLTLFLPCVAQLSVMWKERGWKTSLAILGLVFVIAFGVGYLLNTLLVHVGGVL